jgi:hypothetical protein
MPLLVASKQACYTSISIEGTVSGQAVLFVPVESSESRHPGPTV